jgi:hypothetical protein
MLALFALAVALTLGAWATTSQSPAALAADGTPAATLVPTMAATATAQPFTLLNLNTATDAQFLTIPGMNNRMVREFNEYRPYTSILQFRKEIGKYVDAATVAGYEKYVYVPIKVDESDAATLQQIPGLTADLAAQLVAARPYQTNEAFLTKLATLLTADQTIYAANYLEGTVKLPASLVAATPAATAVATSAATSVVTQQAFALFDLNTATDAQFLTIPGMNNRMVREFNEYRPYTSILQFRKEISKYVDAATVAGYEKYVYVPIKVDEADAATLQQIPGVTADIAAQLVAARPYQTNEAFLTKLATLVTADQAAYAKNYLAASK